MRTKLIVDGMVVTVASATDHDDRLPMPHRELPFNVAPRLLKLMPPEKVVKFQAYLLSPSLFGLKCVEFHKLMMVAAEVRPPW